MNISFHAIFNTDGDFRFDDLDKLIEPTSPVYHGAVIHYNFKNDRDLYEITIDFSVSGEEQGCKQALSDFVSELMCNFRTSRNKVDLIRTMYDLLVAPLDNFLWPDDAAPPNRAYVDGLTGNYSDTQVAMTISPGVVFHYTDPRCPFTFQADDVKSAALVAVLLGAANADTVGKQGAHIPAKVVSDWQLFRDAFDDVPFNSLWKRASSVIEALDTLVPGGVQERERFELFMSAIPSTQSKQEFMNKWWDTWPGFVDTWFKPSMEIRTKLQAACQEDNGDYKEIIDWAKGRNTEG